MLSIYKYKVTEQQWMEHAKTIDSKEYVPIIVTTQVGQFVHAEWNHPDECWYLWALVNITSAATEEHKIWIVGTGWKLPNRAFNHISTIRNKELVFHVLEEE